MFHSSTEQEVGYVLSSQDFLIYLDGLPTVQILDLLENEQGVRGVVTALHPDKVEAWILDDGTIFPGQLFKRTEKRLVLGVGPSLLGRAINPLGVPIDGKGLLPKIRTNAIEIDQQAPGIETRQFIDNQLITGLSMIDTLIPIGKGQRQLVLGDAHSGKTGFLIDLVVNQASTGTVCIFASIGKPITELRTLLDTLRATKALDHTVVIAASSTDPAPLIYLTPQAAFTVAEYHQKQGKDVLVILDDMAVHAKIYRELSLLGQRSPGRESYPGDIFYAQAHLMERAGRFNKEAGGGSITAIPVAELNLNDFTTFIPTNLMAMTDGHYLFKAALRAQAQIPAIDLSLSVSRVGRQTQPRIMNLLSQKIRQILSEAKNLETVSRFSAELPLPTRIILNQKEMVEEIQKQDSLTFIAPEVQVILFGLILTSFLQDKNRLFLQKHKKNLIELFSTNLGMKAFAKSCYSLSSLSQLISRLEALTPKLKQYYT
ncbi:F0F1 ATP synthase subunit alpha [Candidatus Daviesbacteria bacterium]|nr:F0F1 ATP synthase subunit alpha [Candidatus Daviesbacteria bacterium]